MDLKLTPHPDRRVLAENCLRWDNRVIGYCFTQPPLNAVPWLRLITRVDAIDAARLLEWVNEHTGVTHVGVSQPPPIPDLPQEEAEVETITAFDEEEDDDE